MVDVTLDLTVPEGAIFFRNILGNEIPLGYIVVVNGRVHVRATPGHEKRKYTPAQHHRISYAVKQIYNAARENEGQATLIRLLLYIQ